MQKLYTRWKMAPRWNSIPRWTPVMGCAVLILVAVYYMYSERLSAIRSPPDRVGKPHANHPSVDLNDGKFHWANVPQQYPVASLMTLPTPKPHSIPRIQHEFKKETAEERQVRLQRQDAVRGNFTHAWKGYKDKAWLRDEVAPVSGNPRDDFGGWAATIVDSLDTLWMMGLHDQFKEAVAAVDKIDFSTCSLEAISVFETTIRYLGGFLAAYDLSGDATLLQKAIEIGNMLYKAFDTPNRMPIGQLNIKVAMEGLGGEASEEASIAGLGTLTLEFTRLSQVTGDARYFDAAQRVMDNFDEQQSRTTLPGMWPVSVNARTGDMTVGRNYAIGGSADSHYEYLAKQHIMLGGATPQYQKMYEDAMVPMRRNIFYRPMTANGEDIRLPGEVTSYGNVSVSELKVVAQMQHLSCFVGGMVAVASRIFPDPDGKELALAKQLVEGVLWSYEVMPLGIMPENFDTVPCNDATNCPWDVKKWKDAVYQAYEGEEKDVEKVIAEHSLRPGVVKIGNGGYFLRPEAIESVFILYRVTGDETLRERAWKMFNNIIENTLTDIAHAELTDVTKSDAPKMDRMQSFWLAETLKYFYLIFSEPDFISLDDYVLNTEAHPLKRPN